MHVSSTYEDVSTALFLLMKASLLSCFHLKAWRPYRMTSTKKVVYKKNQVELGMPKKGKKQFSEVQRNTFLHP